MINYRETARTTLRILEPDAEELFNKLAISEKKLTFQRPISRDSDYRTYSMLSLLETLSYTLPVNVGDIKAEGTILEREKTLKNLRARMKLAREEQGTNILYLSFGFILWRENNRPGTPWLKSPLLMMPVSLENSSLNAPYTLCRYDDDIEVNPTLDYLFNAEYGIDLPTFELKNKGSFGEYMGIIEEIVERRGWQLIREVSLGLLSFQKINMYHDLNNDANCQLIMKHPVLRAMGGDYSAVKGLPPQVQNFDFDGIDPKNCYQVVNADSSQQEAILLSQLGVSFVMQGPPGTGKSQTITNIIAEAMADGKKILFVSEKAAALQVVLKRLTEVGLADFCLSLHDYKANKKVIIDNIGANLSLTEQPPVEIALNELTELFRNRETLNLYAQTLHEKIAPLDASIYSAYGRISQLKQATDAAFALDDPTSVSKEMFSEMLYSVQMHERALHAMEGPLRDNPWYKTRAVSASQAFREQLTGQTRGLSDAMAGIDGMLRRLNEKYNLKISGVWREISGEAASVREALALPLFPYGWADGERAGELLSAAKQERKEQDAYRAELAKLRKQFVKAAETASIHDRTLRSSLNEIEGKWTDGVFDLDAKAIGKRFAGSNADTPACVFIGRSIEEAEGALKALRGIIDACGQAGALLGIAQNGSWQDAERLLTLTAILKETPYLEDKWFDPRRTGEALDSIAEARARSESVRSKTSRILDDWEQGVLEIDADAMLSRFKTEYAGFLYRLKGAYRTDMRTLRGLARQVGAQITDEKAIALLQAIRDLNADKAWFAKEDGRLTEILGSRYKGSNTDWVQMHGAIAAAQMITGLFPYGNIPQETVSAILSAVESAQKMGEIRRLNDQISRLSDCRKMLQDMGLAVLEEEKSLSRTAIPQLEKLLAERMEQKAWLNKLLACFKGDAEGVSCGRIGDLADNLLAAEKEKKWFEQRSGEHADLFAGEYRGVDTDWNALREQTSVSFSERAQEMAAGLETGAERLRQMFGQRYTGVETDWDGVIGDLEQVAAFMRKARPAAVDSKAFIEAYCDCADTRTALKSEIGALDEAVAAALPLVEAFEGLFDDEEAWSGAHLTEIADRYERCMNGFDLLDRWVDYAETRRDCDRRGLASFTEAVAKADNSIRDVRDAFEKGFYRQWLDAVLKKTAVVSGFRKRVHEQRLEKFAALDQAQFGIARDRIRDKIISAFPDPYSVSGPRSEIGILKHEMEKKRRIMPLRKLFRSIPKLLLTLKPCLMMSPLSVAYFLEADSYHFDMVIFDEASQIFPQDAIGAILRADQVIIAGDSRQLPPTNFFAANTGGAAADYDSEDEEGLEDEVYDSILEETVNILPNRTLLWHYRSKSEQLIAFSNREIYQNELITFPSPREREADSGVEFIYAEEGYYEAGGKNCNILEAKRCVELIREHIERRPERSLGVIAFSEKQQQAISREIQLFREQNPRYEAFFEEGKEEEFFIKNLENVQGDERDTIIFSVGYARTKEQKANGKPMAMRFGPLGVQGGERRLNVAITRAKRNVKLVSSILPSDIDLSKTDSEGVRMLHDYIAFAMNGTEAREAVRDRAAADEFRRTIAGVLREKGYDVEEEVGCSGYRIDIAVRLPEADNEFAVGIECDGLSYVSARTARDRDRLRRSVLEAMGWQMYRVWSAEWFANPDVEGQKLTEFIDAAIARAREKRECESREQEIRREADDSKHGADGDAEAKNAEDSGAAKRKKPAKPRKRRTSRAKTTPDAAEAEGQIRSPDGAQGEEIQAD